MTAAAAVATTSSTDTANHVESAWSKLKGPLLDAATEVCGIFKNHQWKPKSWWWNEEVYKAIEKNNLSPNKLLNRTDACTVQGLQCPEGRRQNGRDQGGKNCPH